MEFAYDHVHLISEDLESAVRFYKDVFGAQETGRVDIMGAPGVLMRVGDMNLFIRGTRQGEEYPSGGRARGHGIDHFGILVKGSLDEFCEGLKGKGVTILDGPRDFNPKTRVAFIKAPDGVAIELLNRR